MFTDQPKQPGSKRLPSTFRRGSGRRRCFSPFSQPSPSLIDLGGVEVPYRCLGERPAHLGHPFLPSPVAHHSDAVEVRIVLQGELGIVPDGVQIPSVKILELHEQPRLALGCQERFNSRHERLVVLVMELAAQLEADDLRGVIGGLKRYHSWALQKVPGGEKIPS